MSRNNQTKINQLQVTLDKYELAMAKVERLWTKMPDDPKVRKDIVDAAAELAQLAPEMEKIKSTLQARP